MTASHDLDAERAVLGALLISDRAMYPIAVEDGLRADDFFSERHRHVFRAMHALNDDGERFDRLTIRAWLTRDGSWHNVGDATLDELSGPIVAAGNVRQYARIVRSHALARRLEQATHHLQGEIAKGRDPAELVREAEELVFGIADDHAPSASGPVRLDADVDAVLEAAVTDQRQEVTGVPSGLQSLDRVTGGFQRGNLVIVGARPAMGKSAFVANVALEAAAAGYRIALFTPEMTRREVAERALAIRSRIAANKIRSGGLALKAGALMDAAAGLHGLPVFVDDSTDLPVGDLRAKARRLKQREGLDMVVVDYLQLMRMPKAENKNQAVTELSRQLKVLAGDLNVPVIALSQLSRAVEQRGVTAASKVPTLSDLRESGALEQDANLVIFLFREEYYDPECPEEKRGILDVIVDKHRGGPLAPRGQVEAVIDLPTLRVSDRPERWTT